MDLYDALMFFQVLRAYKLSGNEFLQKAARLHGTEGCLESKSKIFCLVYHVNVMNSAEKLGKAPDNVAAPTNRILSLTNLTLVASNKSPCTLSSLC